MKQKLFLQLIITIFLLLSSVYPAGSIVYMYDDLNRLTSVIYDFGQELTYTYDAGGNLLSMEMDEDTTALTVNSTDPANGAAEVPLDKNIAITFSESVFKGVYFDELTVKDITDNSVVNYTYSIDYNKFIIDPLSDLNNSVTYAVYIPAGAVEDAAGNLLASDYTFSFTTQLDTVAPAAYANPAGGLFNAPQSVTLTASEPAAIYYTTDGSDPTMGSAQYTEALSINDTMVLKFMAVDYADNQSVIYTETYTIDTVAPTISSTDPVNGATNVPLNKVIIVTLSENIQTGSSYGDITLKDSGDNIIAITKSINNNLLTITPNDNLTRNTRYTVNIPAGAVMDMAGNIFANNYSFSFTTRRR